MGNRDARPRAAPAPSLSPAVRSLPRLAAVVLVLLGGVATADMEVLELHHRLAEELVPALAALDEGVVVKAAGSRLILSGDPAGIDRLRDVARRLDVPMRSLRISVRRVSDALAADTGAGVERDRVKVYGTRSAEDDRLLQAVTAIEGRPAFIDTGQSVPIIDRSALFGVNGAAYTARRRYQYRPKGFYATAHVLGDRVIVDISVAHSNRTAADKIQHRRIVSTVSGRPGEWLSLGAVRETAARNSSGIVRSTRSAQSQGERLAIRVEILAPDERRR